MTKGEKKRVDIEQNQTDYLIALKKHRNISGIALKELKLSRQTLSRWREDEEFREREATIRAELEEKHLELLEKHFKNNATAIFFALKALNPEQYDEGVRAARIKAAAMTDPDKIKPVTIILERRERKPRETELKLVKEG